MSRKRAVEAQGHKRALAPARRTAMLEATLHKIVRLGVEKFQKEPRCLGAGTGVTTPGVVQPTRAAVDAPRK